LPLSGAAAGISVKNHTLDRMPKVSQFNSLLPQSGLAVQLYPHARLTAFLEMQDISNNRIRPITDDKD
jgi:hypothetical protein